MLSYDAYFTLCIFWENCPGEMFVENNWGKMFGGGVRGVGLEPGKIQKYIYIIVECIIILSIFDYSVLIT